MLLFNSYYFINNTNKEDCLLGVCWSPVDFHQTFWCCPVISGGLSVLVWWYSSGQSVGKSVGLTSPVDLHRKITRKSPENSSNSRAKKLAFWIGRVRRSPSGVCLEKGGSVKTSKFVFTSYYNSKDLLYPLFFLWEAGKGGCGHAALDDATLLGSIILSYLLSYFILDDTLKFRAS